MMKALRVGALFAAYTTVGFGAEYAVGLLAQDWAPSEPVVVEPVVDVEVEPRLVVDVRPSIVSQVRVRHDGSCTYETQREQTISAQGLRSLAIQAGSGALHVEGQPDLREIVVVGLVCASHEEYLSALDVRVQLSGDAASVVATYPEHRVRDSGHNTARIDLTVLVPLGMAVDIEDSSGDMEVSGTGDLSIDDSSGSIRVRGINGNLVIDDSSGELEVRDVAGNVSIDDGSGGIRLTDVEGSVLLRDGSGGIEIAEIDGDVTIESDGSGGIEVRDVGGDFVVARDGSGGISHSGVEGRVDVPVRRRRGGN